MATIKNLNYQVGDFILQIPELEIHEGQVTVIMGPSGAGKSTLFNLITGIINQSQWQFLVEGVDIAKLPIEEKQLGIVFQSFELFPHLTAKENIEIVMKSRNNLSEQALNQMQDFKLMLGLDRCWSTKAQDLSGGEKQRVALLRAVMSRPRLLLLDEPFSALDESNKAEARRLLQQVLQKTQLTTLMISHDPADAQIFGQNILNMAAGKIV